MEKDNKEQGDTVASPGVLEKYTQAGAIAKSKTVLILGVLQKIIEKCVVGAKIHEICKFGDNLITEEVLAAYSRLTRLSLARRSTRESLSQSAFP